MTMNGVEHGDAAVEVDITLAFRVPDLVSASSIASSDLHSLETPGGSGSSQIRRKYHQSPEVIVVASCQRVFPARPRRRPN